MLVATKVKLSMERLAILNGAYGGKSSGRSPVRSSGRSPRSIDRSRVNTVATVYVYLGKFTA